MNENSKWDSGWLQQCLPLAVLKLAIKKGVADKVVCYQVATVLTACGIETFCHNKYELEVFKLVATVLTACGIETHNC